MTITRIQPRQASPANLRTARRFNQLAYHELTFPVVLGALVALITTLPYIFASVISSGDRHFVGVVLGMDDHAQYFTWMRDFTSANLASNRLTPEPNAPVFFNLLWWTVGKFLAITQISLLSMYSLLRLVAIGVCVAGIYTFLRQVDLNKIERRTALVISVFGSGLGIIWVAHKYITGATDVLHPLDTYTAEPNTFLMMMGFPHFTIALGLLALSFAFTLMALRNSSYLFGILAGATALVLGLQHAYDLITLYAVLGTMGIFYWVRDRRFPWFFAKLSTIIVVLSAPPALYSFWLVTTDPTWKGVLAQFGDAGVFTPSPPHLLVLLGAPFVLALIGTKWRSLWNLSNGDLMVLAWFLVHLPLAYLPVDFQIHLLLGWQIPIAILAARGLHRVILPAAERQSIHLRRGALATIFVLIVATNVYLLSWRFVELQRQEEPFFISNDEYSALMWLGDNATESDVVLAEVEFGRFVPMMSDARSFIGHWANTLDYRAKRNLVAVTLDPSTSSYDRNAILERYSVTHVVVQGTEGQMTLFPTGSAVYQSGAVTIYQLSAGR